MAGECRESPFNHTTGQSVTLCHAVGNDMIYSSVKKFQYLGNNHCGGYAIHIIIPDDQDRFFLFDRLNDAAYRLIHPIN